MRIVVLGGSTPFTAGLVDAIVKANIASENPRLVLHGRNDHNLDVVGRHARHRLEASGWSVGWTTELESALEDADYVLHQIRYGGLKRRAEAELLCSRQDVTCDETLGPAALMTILTSVDGIRRTAEAVFEICPSAWVLNLTNPVSVVTRLMRDAGVTRCLGVCELPQTTFEQVAGVLGVLPEQLEWSYTGLNHRGFLHDFVFDGHDQWDVLLTRLAGGSIGGVSSETMEQLGAVPMKYFSLMRGQPVSEIGRATKLETLGRRLIGEMGNDPNVPPPSLNERTMDWYTEATVPMLRALGSDLAEPLVVNTVLGDGVTWECRALVNSVGVEVIEGQSPPPVVADWIDIFLSHELACLRAVDNPTEQNIWDVLKADPTIQQVQVAPLVREITLSMDP